MENIADIITQFVSYLTTLITYLREMFDSFTKNFTQTDDAEEDQTEE